MANPDLHIQSLVLGPDRVEISFIEARHITDQGVRIQTVQFSPKGMEAEIDELTDAAEALLERYEIRERGPAERLAPRG